MISVIIPASNEENYIGPCLTALFASDPVPGGAEAIVVANGCRDRTAEAARALGPVADAAGWRLVVLDLAQGSKPLALDAGDDAALGAGRVYLDADVIVSAPLFGQLVAALEGDGAIYASGTPQIPRAKSWVTRAYARFWQGLPFNQTTAPGYGLFAVNATGRARWGRFPAIISDDTFVRLQFEPHERRQCAARYDWPMIEGFGPLTRVRRRQDAGVREIATAYPGLLEREAKPRLGVARLAGMALRDPLGFAVYAAVSLSVRLGPDSKGWTRGR
jgi:glycosyltransferase involved in cell wall biosynthesis